MVSSNGRAKNVDKSCILRLILSLCFLMMLQSVLSRKRRNIVCAAWFVELNAYNMRRIKEYLLRSSSRASWGWCWYARLMDRVCVLCSCPNMYGCISYMMLMMLMSMTNAVEMCHRSLDWPIGPSAAASCRLTRILRTFKRPSQRDMTYLTPLKIMAQVMKPQVKFSHFANEIIAYTFADTHRH